jgi:hypothetical protein
VFGSAPTVAIAGIRRSVWVALCTRILLPVHAALLGILLAGGIGPGAALAASAFALGTGVIASRAMVRSVDAIPFTNDATAEGGVELGDLVTGGLVLAGSGAAFALLDPGLRLGAASVTMAAALWMLRPTR